MISERIVWLVAGVVLGVPLGWVLPGLTLLFQEDRHEVDLEAVRSKL